MVFDHDRLNDPHNVIFFSVWGALGELKIIFYLKVLRFLWNIVDKIVKTICKFKDKIVLQTPQ